MTGAYREDLNWLVTDFTTRVADIAHAIVVSADGVPLALSAGIPPMAVEQFSAITSGLTSLVVGAARIMQAGVPVQALVEMDHGLMFVKAISDGSSLAVLAAPECDTRQVSYEMTRLVEAVGELLTPAIRAEVLAEVYRGAGVTLRPRASSFGNLITQSAGVLCLKSTTQRSRLNTAHPVGALCAERWGGKCGSWYWVATVPAAGRRRATGPATAMT